MDIPNSKLEKKKTRNMESSRNSKHGNKDTTERDRVYIYKHSET